MDTVPDRFATSAIQAASALTLSDSNRDQLAGLAWAIAGTRGQFRLFLLRCDYTTLRSTAIAQLQAACTEPLITLALDPQETKLFSALAQRCKAVDGKQLANGVLVTGLEAIADLDTFLGTLNQMRETFREHCRFPIVLLVEAEFVKRFQREAKDFETWASIDVLEVEPERLKTWLTWQRDQLFTALTDVTAPPVDQGLLATCELSDVAATLRDLHNGQCEIEPDILSFYDFLCGRDAYEADRLDEAIAHYERGRDRRSGDARGRADERVDERAIATPAIPHLRALAENPLPTVHLEPTANINALSELVTLHIALCYQRRALLRDRSRPDLEAARSLLLGALESCAASGAWAIVSRFIAICGEVLRDLNDWERLRPVAWGAHHLHDRLKVPAEQVRDYSLLADLALAEGDPVAAQAWIGRVEGLPVNRAIALRLNVTRARSLLALNQGDEAIALLEAQRCQPSADHPRLYIDLLEALRSLYFQRRQYREAFAVRADLHAFEHEHGRRAFIGAARLRPPIGERSPNSPPDPAIAPRRFSQTPPLAIAPEIVASGRQQDVANLVERIARKDLKVTTLYGFSGVGKSSFIHAGLIPALRSQTIETQTIVPVVLRLYDTWWNELLHQLRVALAPGDRLPLPATRPEPTCDDACDRVLAQLRHCEAHNRRPVLIFDQFEEFFFRYTHKHDCNQLFTFLGRCLEIPSLRIVFSIRRTYLYFLLNRPGFECINGDLLGVRVLYRLGNFDLAAGRRILQQLTELAKFSIEPELLDRLIADLGQDYGKIRPIELQIVGAQLQQDGITTLAAYERTRGKTALIERYLDRVIEDCGPEHHTLAELVLYLLAEKSSKRPIKTRSALAKEIELCVARGQVQLSQTLTAAKGDRPPAEVIDLILGIFVGSGLAFQVPDAREPRYQLAHDYLAEVVQEYYAPRFGDPFQALEREKSLRNLTELELRAALERETQARHAAELAQIEAAVRSSQVLFLFDDRREALIAALKAGEGLRSLQSEPSKPSKPSEPTNSAIAVPLGLNFAVLDALRRAVYGAGHTDRLRGHAGWIDSLALSPEGTVLVSGASDGTVRLWPLPIGASRGLEPPCRWIAAVAVSPDGRWLAVAGDRSVFIWYLKPSLDRVALATIEEQPQGTITPCADWVRALAFAADSQTLAIGCHDGTVELVKLASAVAGDPARPETHTPRYTSSVPDSAVNTLAFVAGDRRLVIGTLDGTVLTWELTRDRWQVIGEHEAEIVHLAVDRDRVWVSSTNGAIYRWPLDGTGRDDPEAAKYRQGEAIASFSVDRLRQRIAVGEPGGRVRVWDTSGRELENFTAHRSAVRALCLSPSAVISGSDDRTISLWQFVDCEPGTICQHDRWIAALAVSEDGRYGLSADGSGEIAIWQPASSATQTPSCNTSLHRWQGFDRPIRGAALRRAASGWAAAAIDRVGITRIWTIDGHLQTEIPPPIEVELAWTDITHQDAIYASRDGRVWLADRQGQVWLAISCQYRAPAIPSAETTGAENADNTGNPASPTPSDLDICDICISHDRRQLALGHRSGTVELWAINPATNTAAFLYPIVTHRRPVSCLRFSPDDQQLAIGDCDRGLSIWILASRQSRQLTGHAAAVNSLCFSRSGRVLISGSYDRTLRLWDSASGEPLHTITEPTHPVDRLCLVPQRRAFISGGRDRSVRLWNFELADLLDRGQAIIATRSGDRAPNPPASP